MSTPHGRVWECRRAVDTSQIQPVMPREAGASGVLLNYAILPYDMLYSTYKRRWQNTLVTKFCPGVCSYPPIYVSAFSHESIGEPENMKHDVGGQGPRDRPQTSEPVAV